ncbi:MAG: hypothetical protein DWH94_01090 [Planctomycetota bacterium]|nr:MAG: hypothetical protein DWH80_11225 [Planctomycetota bacterium]RLS61236.1 MAG: hypothetical protein DWH94_01090 [Planctomycetota bacterium]TSA03201.1 MAG: hypothetical protein D4R77_11575 [Planctomycetaceae bacterium]
MIQLLVLIWRPDRFSESLLSRLSLWWLKNLGNHSPNIFSTPDTQIKSFARIGIRVWMLFSDGRIE